MSTKMEYARKNTVMVRFGDQSKSPSDGEMVTFVVRNLGIEPVQVSHLYSDPYEKSIVIKFVNETLMKMCLEQHMGEQSFGYSSGQYTQVMVTDGNEQIKYVRLFYLPPEVPNREVTEFLKRFGIVKQIVQEKRSVASGFHCFSGIRGIYMDVIQPIPPQVYICNYRSRVYYSGMQERCFICKAMDHLKSDCPQRAGPDSSTSSYLRERVRKKVESLKLNSSNLINLATATEEKNTNNSTATGPCTDDLDVMGVTGVVDTGKTVDPDVVGVVDNTTDARLHDRPSADSSWVDIMKHESSVNNGSSNVDTHSGQLVEATTSKTVGYICSE